MTSESLWNYYRDEVNNSANETDDNDNKRNNDKKTTSKSFEYKIKIIGTKPNDNSRLNVEVVVPLKSLSNFWRSLDLPLISCKIELDLTWLIYCLISEISRTPEVGGANPACAAGTTGATFKINNAKNYVPVVTNDTSKKTIT